MRIELSEIDKNNIENINTELEKCNEPPLFINEINREYFINFTCTDIGKANVFVATLLSNTENSKNIQETLGIRVNSLNYCDGDTKLSILKNKLKEFLEELERI